MRIFDFALVANWEERLEDLATLAEPERWRYLHVPAGLRLPVLDGYVRHTFLRLAELGRIATTETLACFNTGLLSRSQEEIFGLFTIADRFNPNQPIRPANKKWFLKTWARAGDRILTEFQELPAMATYWSDPAQLVFDPTLQVQLNVDHIVRDNLNRFPEEIGGKLSTNGVPTDLDLSASETDDDRQEGNGGAEGQQAVPLAARNALEGAMKHSIRLAQRSYRIAVPQYHHDRIQLLLPLYLRNSERADLALTLERHGNWYRAATVLYPDWAYRQARLLTRPNSEWLGGFREDLDPNAPA